MQINQPKLPIPEPLRGKEFGTFTHESIVERLPDIGRRMLEENDFNPDVKKRIETLIQEIPDGRLRPLVDPGAPDEKAWRDFMASYQGQNWLQAPWFLVENYFYRRVLEATGYFQPGEGQGVDPFAFQKRRGLLTSQDAIGVLGNQVAGWMEDPENQGQVLGRLLAADLWGNQADLSLWPADETEKPDHQETDQQAAHTLVDDTAAIVDHLLSRPGRVDFLIDNAGFEVVADLFLAVYLLHHRLAETVHLHLKAHPTFVSDATATDIRQTVVYLAGVNDPEVSSLGRQLDAWIDNGRLRLQQEWFWTSPLEMWRMPPSLRRELASSHLLISKGDANYRRLLGDRHWPFTTPFADIVSYMPVPLVALRTLKSEVAAGLAPGRPEDVREQDANWLINGRWGVIQFFGE